ncbi:uncharacterized protein LOC120129765 [Hibiscus syriacus]|uniref:uncharacterized protein LOC120129765 n=1 Tax=Hibiscus syriacus TaxID=106335 RepID=UPI0019238B47|nr:uncharacterized protein LOC120129765 [Hibiscus syriacus]
MVQSPPQPTSALSVVFFPTKSRLLLDSELWGIYTGLRLAWNLGFRNALVQAECLEAIEDPHSIEHLPSLAQAIAHLRQRCWETACRWIPQEANKIADSLAKSFSLGLFEVALLESAPPSLERLLPCDIEGSSYIRT